MGKPEAKVPEAFLAFFDDAAIFPPGLAPLEKAVHDHLARRGTQLAAAVGPLILPLSALPEARDLAEAEDLSAGPVHVSAVTPAGNLMAALAAAEAIRPQLLMTAVELKTSADPARLREELGEAAAAAAAEPGLQISVELTAAQIAAGALEQLEGTGLRLKFRTGGIQADLFPTPAELAAVLEAAVGKGIPFKLTAGLHQAVRFTNPATGFTHHGFLNVAVATASHLTGLEGAGPDGAGSGLLEAALVETDGAKLAEQFARLGTQWRTAFTSFGTCSVAEPADSLAELDLFPAGAADTPNSQT
jgi:hypothetical protein